MDKPIYIIDGTEFTLKPYNELTFKQEKEIDRLLGFTAPDQLEVNVSCDPNKLFPLILVTIDPDKKVDFENVTFSVVQEIISDFIVERLSFLARMPRNLESLAKQKMNVRPN